MDRKMNGSLDCPSTKPSNEQQQQPTTTNNASSRVFRKLQAAMENGNFYEAHQTYRSLYFRYMTQKKYDELLQLLYDGSTNLLDRSQVTSGCDLAILFTDVLEKASYPVVDWILDRIECIFERLIRRTATANCDATPSKFNVDNDEEEFEAAAEGVKTTSSSSSTPGVSASRDLFVANLIRWAKKVAPKYKNGHPALHARLASSWWRMKNYEQSRYHFLRSDDAEGCAIFLVEYHVNKGYPNEVDLFVTQAVLQFLCHKEKTMANAVFFKYTRYHPAIVGGGDRGVSSSSSATISKNASSSTEQRLSNNGEPPYSLPLFNFVWLLLLCIDTGRVTDYSILIEKYQPSIKRDPCYTDYLDRIGQLFFGLPPPTNSKSAAGGGGIFGGGFLKNLMSGLLGDDNNDNDNDNDDAVVEERREGGGGGQSSVSSADDTFESVPGTPTFTAADQRPPPNQNATANTNRRQATATAAKMATDETLD